jgi:BMFP domain-containing protein YqiC
MIDQKLLSELAEKLFNNLPGGQVAKNGLNLVKEDITKTFRVVLEQAFSDLDLVTKQQFDIQAKVLAKTREQLDTLTKQVAALEKSRIN